MKNNRVSFKVPSDHAEKANVFASAMSAVSACFLALRPWSLHISLEPVALGAAIAYRLGSGFGPWAFLGSALTTLCVHSAGNVVNSYFDYEKGLDSTAVLSANGLVRLGAFLYALGLSAFLAEYTVSVDGRLLALVFFGGMCCSFLYTAGPYGLKYIGLGDVVVMLTFGPLSVLYSFLCQVTSFSPRDLLSVLLYAAPLALNSEAIVHANNVRDRIQDQRAGVMTLAVQIGPQLSHVLYALLLFAPYISFAVVALSRGVPAMLLPLITLPSAFQLERECRFGLHSELDKHTARLNAYFSMFYILAIAMTQRLPGFSYA
ncbi:ubiA prenyltransferase domain-containing protein 1-like [Tropilaelaps mercedesae]|uniref:UbiA prenyltransferase domain-containing protein 1-like n=1 Tax=Tropilaelaps mercedesae TaxID=418985 RepID=A0A1V9Y0J1_9ACAR|nr:ubiA prenyltransferase domain-containing protein 1-like [Tropilaelaps mercedesae]